MNDEHLFYTSGSTGAPRQWLRSREQMECEARLIYQRWAADVSEIFSFAPPSHSYGQILGEAGSRVTDAPVQYCSLERQQLPHLDGSGRCVILAIASTWHLLPRLLDRLAGQRPVLVLHSASLLPPDALKTVSRYAGQQVRFVELLGATETGAMAFRELDTRSNADQPWTLLDDVELLVPIGQPGPLEIASPRIARERGHACASRSHCCDDLVLPLDARRFQWLGRASSLIKVNGLRVDLARLGSELGDRLQCPTLACVPVRDPLRAEAYQVLFCSASLTKRDVLAAFTGLPAGTPRPVGVRRVAHLPLSATGKPQPWAASFT
ncbi:TPA: AMP-binding protein [Citrobacter freundii]|uniref:AMP-binding protein n=1 Tax=Gammaproteobacteria TaxID=1236 RepID=UPI00079792FC|nr:MULTISPECIES: AMP-binding protein [Gammaproteobacteria]MBN5418824.1 AMP-binding protein [Serratia marcescens]SAF37855.1 AMP-dependent synthetase and ligase [Enterobacter hormaechei]HBV8384423.1 AMP-binding protein [Citrobacter freundii]HDY6068319.1 AMP-binding protein [Pseudomonas aeruginosa]